MSLILRSAFSSGYVIVSIQNMSGCHREKSIDCKIARSDPSVSMEIKVGDDEKCFSRTSFIDMRGMCLLQYDLWAVCAVRCCACSFEKVLSMEFANI